MNYKTINCNRFKNIEIRVILCVIIALISATACKNDSHHLSSSGKDKEQIDSTVNANMSITGLETLLQRYSREKNNLGIVVTCRELGKRYRECGRFNDAIDCHRKGGKVAESLHDTIEIIRALNNIGTNFRRLGIIDEASSYHYQALSYAELYSDKDNKEICECKVASLNGIGNIYLTLGNQVAADTMFRIALKGEIELGSSVGQAINYANIGSVKESEGDLDSAWIYYCRSMDKNIEAKSDLGIALCDVCLGQLLEKKGQQNRAIKKYMSAYKLMEKSSDEWHWIDACLSLSHVFITEGRIGEAQRFLDKAEYTAKKMNSLEHIGDVYRQYSELNEKVGDNKKALYYYKKSIVYFDSVNNMKNVSHLLNMRMKYEQNRRQKEMNLIKQNYSTEQKLNKIFFIAAISVLLLAIVVIVFLWYGLRMRSKNQCIMSKMEQTRISFFTNITHEFRTPLTVIVGFGKQLQCGKIPEGQSLKSVGSAISRQGESLLGLINQLLDISKIRSDIGEPEWRRGNIVAYIHMVVELYKDYALQKCIELNYLPVETNVIMDFVPNYISKIIRNLISNSLKYTPECGRIHITSKVVDNKIVISVIDNGRGIESSKLQYIFEPFYQADDSGVNIGTGIGLSLVSHIVKSMDGSIKVDSNIGEGSKFTVTLPLRHGSGNWKEYVYEEPMALSDLNDYSESNKLPNGNDSKNGTIPTLLIIEDNSDVAYYIGSQLSDKYCLCYAVNGKDGLEKAQRLMPDMIITDLMMPEMDGLGLCHAIRSSELLNHIPIVMITAKCTEDERVKCIEAGVDAYIYKPFNSDELKAIVAHLLDTHRKLRDKYSQALHNGTEKEVYLSPSNQDFINKLVDVVYAQMKDGDVDVETVASKMYMSRSQLARKVLAVTGQSTSSYILQIRMNRAKLLLDSNESIPIGDVAFKCGFSDVAHFSRLFKQINQMTPTQYRRRVK